ncbi:hypothetical protein TrST_g8256, partial [Triparma strigata]
MPPPRTPPPLKPTAQRDASQFARLSKSFSEQQLGSPPPSPSAPPAAKRQTMGNTSLATELWASFMTEVNAEKSATSFPWNEDLVGAIELWLFDGEDMTEEEVGIVKDALCKRGSDEALLIRWKKFFMKWKKSEHADSIIPFLNVLHQAAPRTMMGGLTKMVRTSFRKRGSSKSARPPVAAANAPPPPSPSPGAPSGLPPPPPLEAYPQAARARATTVDIKGWTGKVSANFEEKFYKNYESFCDLRFIARKTQEERTQLGGLFGVLKAEATSATQNLQPLIQSCMEFYRTAGGPGHFRLDPDSIRQMKLTKTQL